MAESTSTILLAERASEWRDLLARGLVEAGFDVTLRDDGESVRDEIIATSFSLYVVGDDLEGMSGLDAVYFAHLDRLEKGIADAPNIGVITRHCADFSLLDVIRSRGVRDFVQRGEPINDVVELIVELASGRRRVSARIRTVMKTTLKFKSAELRAKVVDISSDGAQARAPASRAPERLYQGQRVVLVLGVERGEVVRVPAEIRWIKYRRVFLRRRVHFGIRFLPPDEEMAKRIAELVTAARAVHEARLFIALEGD